MGIWYACKKCCTRMSPDEEYCPRCHQGHAEQIFPVPKKPRTPQQEAALQKLKTKILPSEWAVPPQHRQNSGRNAAICHESEIIDTTLENTITPLKTKIYAPAPIQRKIKTNTLTKEKHTEIKACLNCKRRHCSPYTCERLKKQ